MADCYCGLKLHYSDCCEPYHNTSKLAQTAEVLMRSRYSAFVVKHVDYLLATWDATKCPANLNLSNDTTVWLRLEIIRCHKGRETHSQGTVEFKAYYQQDGQHFVLHEISRFKKNQGTWLYIDGATKVSEQ
ncbi:YchJ family protein [Crenothrix polyspora]|uniref:YchJ-like middle NTF2-like domain-containing protein n=1 Tax=Crenothrix polyspora TaxID=360316 RepID=A0A1R4H5J4_9GAMM|nr:YchJ family protein [Crenothrix polyspora]SJM91535.1 conserved hypothetical protein [Crenothrix polyspora]